MNKMKHGFKKLLPCLSEFYVGPVGSSTSGQSMLHLFPHSLPRVIYAATMSMLQTPFTLDNHPV